MRDEVIAVFRFSLQKAVGTRFLFDDPEKKAERQTLPEKLSFQNRQVSGRILAKTELLPAGFFTLLQVRT